MRIIFLGAPGAGKGTQADKVGKKLNIPIISTGDIFRYNIKNETELGLKVKAIIDGGELVPDSMVNELVLDRISKDDCENGFILDGYPRTIPQAEAFDAADGNIDHVIDIEVPDDAIVARMSGRRVCPACGDTYHTLYNPPTIEGICNVCGADLIVRDDDKEDVVRNRLEVYHKNTQPLIDYYGKSGKVSVIDGTKDINEVHKDIMEALEK